METPMNPVPSPAPETIVAPEAARHMSPLMVTLIVGAVVALVAALAYFSWTLREQYQEMVAAENARMADGGEMSSTGTTSTSDEVDAIEADVAATDLEEIDAEMAAMDAELESFEAELYAE